MKYLFNKKDKSINILNDDDILVFKRDKEGNSYLYSNGNLKETFLVKDYLQSTVKDFRTAQENFFKKANIDSKKIFSILRDNIK